MWSKFTESAKLSVFHSQEEAGKLGGNLFSTEHLLLGLVRVEDNVAGQLLSRFGVPPGQVRQAVHRHVTRGNGNLKEDMQLTDSAKRAIDFAYKEAKALNDAYIGTEHLLLGLVAEAEGLAGRVLSSFGVTGAVLRDELARFRQSSAPSTWPPAPMYQASPEPARRTAVDPAADQSIKTSRTCGRIATGLWYALIALVLVQGIAIPFPIRIPGYLILTAYELTAAAGLFFVFRAKILDARVNLKPVVIALTMFRMVVIAVLCTGYFH